MPSSTSILLKNGVALIHDSDNHVVPTKTDILIQNDRIAKIEKDIEPDAAEVIDCTDKIISPGFIDTHRHGWQTQLKGRHANELLLAYMVSGNAQACQFSAKDVFYGQLAGMLESIAAGTTTVVDHAHITVSPDHAKMGIAGAASSGIRSVYCYTPVMRIKSWNPLTYHDNPLEDWVMETFSNLASEGPWADGRITLGFAFDLFFLGAEVVKGIFAVAKKGGIQTITIHSAHGPQLGGGWPGGITQLLKEWDLLDEHILFSHSNNIDRADADLIRQTNAHISSTPSTELQMAMGRPACFDASFLDGKSAGLQDHASLGIDCHSYISASIIGEARIGLQNARANFNEYYLQQGKTTAGLPDSLSVEAAFNLATVKGAEAARMEKDIGRIAEGFKADLAIFDALSPALVAAAQHDPIAAIILHSSPADIDTVIVDGKVRKQNGRLVDTAVEEQAQETVGKANLSWVDVAKELVGSRGRMQAEIDTIDFEEATATLKKVFHVDESVFVAT
ncbi:hypothetical protein BDV96DRAFT_683937 [Lophiotrema nucula]|uniref:Amidohydrolase-related domain-containing protein n=1 Tax=Lophiotrema nucula TaxID=690887 RepID=A0A6A5ZKD9_9PLEO|nr:hypothetical protein BDV96DRAFT_683937 [Lophiotrema nucula]